MKCNLHTPTHFWMPHGMWWTDVYRHVDYLFICVMLMSIEFVYLPICHTEIFIIHQKMDIRLLLLGRSVVRSHHCNGVRYEYNPIIFQTLIRGVNVTMNFLSPSTNLINNLLPGLTFCGVVDSWQNERILQKI